jgi:cell division protein FtsB
MNRPCELALRKLPSWRRVLIGLLCFCAVRYVGNGVVECAQKRAQYEQIQRQIQQAEREQEELHRRIKELKTDPQAIEKLAREEFGFVRPGEYAYRLTPGKPASSTTPLPPKHSASSSILRLPLAAVAAAVLLMGLFQLRRKANPTAASGH